MNKILKILLITFLLTFGAACGNPFGLPPLPNPLLQPRPSLPKEEKPDKPSEEVPTINRFLGTWKSKGSLHKIQYLTFTETGCTVKLDCIEFDESVTKGAVSITFPVTYFGNKAHVSSSHTLKTGSCKWKINPTYLEMVFFSDSVMISDDELPLGSFGRI